jgi:hypothetical protein
MCIQTTGRYSLVGNCNPSHRPNRQFTTSAGLSSARPVRRSSRFKHKSVACCHFEVFRGPGGQKPHSQPKLRNGCRLIRPIGCTDLRSFRTLAFAVLEPRGNPGNLLQILRVLSPSVGCHLLCCLSEISGPVCKSGASRRCDWNQRRTH